MTLRSLLKSSGCSSLRPSETQPSSPSCSESALEIHPGEPGKGIM